MNGVRTILASAMLAASMLTTAPACADDRADVEAATNRWVDAFNRKSTREIVSLYAADAVLFGTSSPVLRDQPGLIGDYFKDLPALGDAVITVEDHRVQLFGDIAISTGFYTRSSKQDGETVRNPARFTFVYQKRNGTWLILNHHSSALPQAQP
jgi:uncharacterized protein (TIGR02246 family)